MAYNLGEIAKLLTKHSTPADIRLLLADLIGQGYERPEFQNYDDLEGQTRLEKILTILQVMQGFGDDEVRLVCEIMKKVRENDKSLHDNIDKLCQQKSREPSSPSHVYLAIITLFVASIAFLGLLFGIVAIFKFAVGGNIAPSDFIILTPAAVVLALVLYPFILVLLNIFTPQMAQQQFNALHSFVGSTFPSLIGWLNNLSHFFEKQQKSTK